MVNILLPNIASLEEYRMLYRRQETWLPAMQEICQRHDLDAKQLSFAPPGSHVVFYLGDSLVIKLCCPLWPEDCCREKKILLFLAHWDAYQIPRVLAEGEIEGWPYLILSRVEGIPLDHLWPDLDESARFETAEELGALMASLHQIPTASLEFLEMDWLQFIQGQVSNCLDQQAQGGASPDWLAQIQSFLANLPPLMEPIYSLPGCTLPGFTPVFLHADLNPEHLFMTRRRNRRRRNRWTLSGLIDFADAMLGHPYYEFIAPAFITRGQPGLLKAMLRSYGLPAQAFTPELSRQLMAYTLLHRFANLPEILVMFGPETPASLVDLQAAMWSLPGE